jgi:hypothetical protein
LTKINEAGKTYFIVEALGKYYSTAAQIKAGQMLLILQLYELERLHANPALEYTQNNTGLISGTACVVYSVSEDTAGNLQTTVNTLNVTTSSVAVLR